jgi:predicted RNase H-like HicB family nuclease
VSEAGDALEVAMAEIQEILDLLATVEFVNWLAEIEGSQPRLKGRTVQTMIVSRRYL